VKALSVKQPCAELIARGTRHRRVGLTGGEDDLSPREATVLGARGVFGYTVARVGLSPTGVGSGLGSTVTSVEKVRYLGIGEE
jgi:hypothetical protein